MSAGSAGRRQVVLAVLAFLAASGCGAEAERARPGGERGPGLEQGPFQRLPGGEGGRDVPPLEARRCADCSSPPALRLPRLKANAEAIDFGTIVAGSRGKRILKIVNEGDRSAHLRGSVSSPVFSVDSSALEAALDPGRVVSLSLEAGADSIGSFSGTLALGEPGVGTLLEVPLSVDVVAPVVSLPEEIEFGARPPGTSWKRWVSLSLDDPSRGVRVLKSGVEGEGFGPFSVTAIDSSLPIDSTVEAEVTFGPTITGDYRAELIFELSDPSQPKVRVLVHGTAVNTNCSLQVFPAGLMQFKMALGVVRASMVHRRTIWLLNAGTADCLVWNVMNQLGTTIPVRAAPPYWVEPGEVVALDVEVWAEDHRNPYFPEVSDACPNGKCVTVAANTVQVFHSRSATPPLRLFLEAGAFQDLLVSDPEVVELEAAPGDRETRRVRFSGPDIGANRWGAASYLKVTSDSSPAFALEPFDPPPRDTPLDGFTFDVSFAPVAPGPHAGWIELRTAGINKPLRIELLGISR